MLEFDLSLITTNDAVGGASAGLMEIKVPMTQAESELGTGTRFSFTSPERQQQAIVALAESRPGKIMAYGGWI